ncbi:MAG: N,N-dimethylformamidase beta subunit family domain-containing protein [Jatrophihabitantaceae bacterium]
MMVIADLLAGCTGPSGRVGAAAEAGSASLHLRPPAGIGEALAWEIPRRDDGGIEGFADPISVLPGQRVRLFVSTAARSFRVRAFRMGWYGGALGRLTWTSTALPGRRQPAAVVVPGTGTVITRWSPSMSIDTTAWQPGDYLLQLAGDGGAEQFVPLTVRFGSAAGRVVLISPVTTWQAYNRWGGRSLYTGEDGTWAHRSRAVSFDRPYTSPGAGDFIAGELPVLAEAQRLGLRLDYVTDLDLATVPHLLAGARAVVSMGHDEYWSPAMRAVLTAAREAGANLAFLGANAIYRRIRMGATPLGPNRLETNYKYAAEDPLRGRNNAAITANWPDPPDANPESRLIGAQYGCALTGTATTPGVIADPSNWLFTGMHLTSGEHLPGLLWHETDAVQLAFPTPRPIEVLLHSPVHCRHHSSLDRADSTYYVAPSGAGVFDAGTMGWACAIRDSCEVPVPASTRTIVRAVTDNLLRTFARGPAGPEHPAHDNLASLGIGN